MKFEAKVNQSKPYWHGAIIFLAFLGGSYFSKGSVGSSEIYVAFSAAMAWLVLSYILNNQYSVISVTNGNVSFGSKGMVSGNFKSKDILEVENNYNNSSPHILVKTMHDSRFSISVAGFSRSEVDEIINCIKT